MAATRNAKPTDSQRRIKYLHLVYLEASGAPSMPWENWRWLLDLFLTGSNLDAAAEKMKLAVLFGSLGAEGTRVAFYLTDGTTNYNDTMIRLSDRFGERQSLIYARTRFYRRAKQTGEEVLSYVTELRRLTSYSKFNAVELESVRDRLVAGGADYKIRKRLFEKPKTLTRQRGHTGADCRAGVIGVD